MYNINPAGFGTSMCAVTVKLGSDHSCTVTSVNDRRIRCKVDIATEPPVYTLFEAKVNILGIFSSREIDSIFYVYSVSMDPDICWKETHICFNT